MRQRRNRLGGAIHFVWTTHDRLPLLTENIEREVYRYIEQVCRDDRFDVLAIGGMPDHVHLLIDMNCRTAFSALMQHIKGGSSRIISGKLKPDAWFAWQENYAAFAVSPRDKNRVIAYIQNQKQHHANGTLWLEAEKTYEEDDDTEDAFA